MRGGLAGQWLARILYLVVNGFLFFALFCLNVIIRGQLFIFFSIHYFIHTCKILTSNEIY